MTENSHVTLLRRMTHPQDIEVAENPLTSSRAVRLALTKAANDTIGLIITVQSVGEHKAKLDDMLAGLDHGLMLISLTRADRPAGLIALDMQLRGAIVEMQTIGALIGQKVAERPATNTDAAMCDAVLGAFLRALPDAVTGTEFEGWGDDVVLDTRYSGARAAGLVLDDCRYRIVTLRVDLGVAEREGTLTMALPLVEAPVAAEPVTPEPVKWQTAFQDAIATAPARLDAMLHVFSLPLETVDALSIGQVVPLPGCTVDALRLIDAHGGEVAQAKLGQMGGMRAARLQAKPAAHMAELATHAATDPPEMLLPDKTQDDVPAPGRPNDDAMEPTEVAITEEG